MLYDIKRDGVTLIEHEIKGKRIKSAPAVDYIEVEFDYFEPVLLKKNDTIEFKGEIYYCDKQSVNIFKKSTNLYNHRARFLGENYKATEIALLSPDFYEHNFDIEGNLLTLVTLAVSNLNRIDSGWSFDEDLPATITKKFEIKEENVMSFLAKVSGEFEIPFRIENKVITFAYYEHPDGGEFEYGKGKGFLDLKKSYRNGEKAPNTIFATGGNGFQLNDPIQDDDDVDENGVIEGFYTNERIYPTTRANVLSSVQSNVFRTDLDFSIYANSIPGQRALINFETGALAGLSFFLQNEQYDIEGFKILTITKRFVDGVEYPNLTARPLGGDRYNITNINMPQDVIDDATDRLTIATQNYLRNILDRNLVLDANLDPLYQEDLKLNDRIKIVNADLDINGYFIINEIKEDLQNLNRKEITLDYVGRNLLNLNLPVVNDNIIEVEIEEINTEIQDIIVETGRLKVEVEKKVDFENVVGHLSDTNPLNIPNVSAVNEGLYQTLSTANQYTDTAVEGAVYDVTYENDTHEITFYRHQQPNIVIDLPIERLITGVELVGNDLVFTFEDGSVVTVPMNTLLVGVVKKVNGLTPNSQGEVVINIADIPGLSTELNKIGALTTLTTTDKSSLVNAINEVNGNIPNVTGFVPYTGANQAVNLNTQTLNTEGLVQIKGVLSKTQSSLEMSRLVGTTASNHLRKYTDVASTSRGNDTSTLSDCVVIKLPIRTSTKWVMEVDIFGASSASTFSGAVTLLIAGYGTNNSQRVVSVIGGYSDRVKSVSFCRDEQNNSVIIVRFESDSTNFTYGKVNINKFYHGVTYNSDLDVKSNFSVSFEQEASLTGLTTNGTITNSQFTRDSYLDFRQYGLGRYVTTLSGNSIDNGFTETGFYFVGGLDTNIVGTTNGKLINLGNPNYSGVQGQLLLPHGGSNELAFRSTQNNSFSRVWHSGNFNPAQYVQQSSLNTQLANYVPINGVTTINNTKTFTSSPVVPNGTLNSHAVNLGQLNTILGDYATVADWSNTLKKNESNTVTEDFEITRSNIKFKVGYGGAIYGESQGLFSIYLGTGDGAVISYQMSDGSNFSAYTTGFGGYSTYGWTFSLGSGTSRMKMPVTGNTFRTLATGAKVGATTYYANTQGVIELPELSGNFLEKDASNTVTQDFEITNSIATIKIGNYGAIRGEITGFSHVEVGTDDGYAIDYVIGSGGFSASINGIEGNGGNDWSLRNSNNVISHMRMPGTGNMQRTLAVGATMGGTTYYANENGLIGLPNITPPSINTTVKLYMPGEVANNDTVSCNASKTIIYLSPTFTGPLNIAIDPELQDGAELIVIHTHGDDDTGLFNINGSFINHTGQLVSTYQASQGKTYRFIHVKDLERFALVDVGSI